MTSMSDTDKVDIDTGTDGGDGLQRNLLMAKRRKKEARRLYGGGREGGCSYLKEP